jgi:cytochrome P450
MTAPTEADLYYDPYSVDLNMNPYPVFARIREEAPVYYNEKHDFYALSRWDDVHKGVIDHETFISGRGRDELLLYLTVIATAGSETTTRMLGWAGKTLADVPDQRRELAQNPALIPQAIEELLRWEPPALQMARYVTRDVQYYGQTVPAGSAMLLLIGAANRDGRRFAPDGDLFDIHREPHAHMTFGAGVHFCLGNALARMEGHIAMEEILKRFPEWEVDWANAVPSDTAAVRGWSAMPTFVS